MAAVPNATRSVSSVSSFSVAIIGGGIGGLLVAIGLLEYPHIDVQVYESAPSFGEIGAGVAIGPNAQRALEMISPAAKAALDKNVTGNTWLSKANTNFEFVVGKGEHAGELIHAEKNATGMQSVHRARFLDELVKAVPAQRAHFNKRLQDIEDKDGSPVALHFTDGTSAAADVLIGADGIHSMVRRYLLGAEAAKPSFSGSVAYRGLPSMDAAVEKLGAEYAQNSTVLCGPGRAIVSYPIEGGKLLNMAAIDLEYPSWEDEKWTVPTKWEELAQRFEGWGPQAKAAVELLDTPDLVARPVYDTQPASTYTRHRVAILGDAAHASTPYQAQGAGQAIEDALIISTVLSKVNTPEQLPKALMAYDQIRRPRSQRVVETSREAGKLVGMTADGVGEDLDKMREHFETRMNWIWQRNMNSQKAETVELFEESL